jgi:hypothetical protein
MLGVAAFANIARSLAPEGRLVFCCWQPLEANDWMHVPGLAVTEHVPLPPAALGDQPGPFALGDPDRIRSILGDAGFTRVDIEGIEADLLVAGGGSVVETMGHLITSGTGGAVLDGSPEPARRAAIDAVREVLEPLHDGEGVRLGGAAWVVTARPAGTGAGQAE